MLQPIAQKHINVIISGLAKGQLITAHDIDLATTATFKEALWEVTYNKTEEAKLPPPEAPPKSVQQLQQLLQQP